MSFPPFDQYNEIYGSTPSTPHPQQQQQHPDPPGAFPQWETIEHPQDLEMQMHESPHDLDTTPLHTPTSTSFHTRHLPQIDIDLDNPPHVVPSHAHSVRASPVDNAPILLRHPHDVPQHHLPMHAQQQQYEYPQHISHAGSPFDPFSITPSESPPQLLDPSSSSSTGAKPATGVVRQSTRGERARQTHPYPRSTPGSNMNSFLFGQPGKSPESSAAASPAASGPAAGGPKTRSKQSVRFSGTGVASAVPAGMVPRPATARSSSSSSAMPSPATTRAPLVGATRGSTSNTRTSISPQGSSNLSSTQLHPPPNTFKTPTLVHNPPLTPTPQSNRIPLTSIKADMHYSRDNHILTASLELPGVKREHLRVTLGTAYFNKVRYVSVIAESWPVFDVGGEYPLRVPPTDDRGNESAGKKAKDKENVEGDARNKTPSPTCVTPTSSTQQKSSPISDSWLQGILGQEIGIPKQPGTAALKGVSRIVNPNLRERRFGVMRRVIQVPESTTLKDIEASLEDGVLTLRIDFGEPYPHDDEIEVPIL